MLPPGTTSVPIVPVPGVFNVVKVLVPGAPIVVAAIVPKVLVPGTVRVAGAADKVMAPLALYKLDEASVVNEPAPPEMPPGLPTAPLRVEPPGTTSVPIVPVPGTARAAGAAPKVIPPLAVSKPVVVVVPV